MKIHVHYDLCTGHARCQECCPEVFSTDESYGRVVLLMEQVPEALRGKAELAVRNCPEGALEVVEASQEETQR